MSDSPLPPIASDTRTHCHDCDRRALCDIIRRGTAPCGMNAGMGVAAGDLYEETEAERRRLDAKVAELESQVSALTASLEQATRRVEELEAMRVVWDSSIRGAWASLEDEKRRSADTLDLARQVDDMEQRLTRAKSALENWGRHHPWCHLISNPEAAPLSACNCGYIEAIKDAEAPASPVSPATTSET